MKFEIYKAFDGRKIRAEWRWRLIARNKKIIAQGEGYERKSKCLHAIKLVQGCGNAPVVEATD